MKILFVIDSLGFGGAERQLVELVKGLNRFEFEIHIVCLSNKEGYSKQIQELGLEIHVFQRRYKYDFGPILYLSKYIKKNNIELVHAFMTFASLYAMIACKLSGRPIVSSAIRDGKDQNIKGLIAKRLLAKTSNIFVANSKAGFNNRFSKLRPHFKVVYNGVDLNRFKSSTIGVKKLKDELGISKFEHVIGMVGSFTDHKDQQTLLEAFDLVLRELPNSYLLLIGDGPKKNDLCHQVEQLGIKEKVSFLGYRKDVDQLYCLLDVFILLTNNTIHLEGISNAIIEAMMAQVPVIASRGGGTDEIISDGLTGVIVPPDDSLKAADAIVYLLKDPNTSKDIVDRAGIFARRAFNLDRYVDDYKQIYGEML